MSFNPYFIGCAAMAIFAFALLFTRQILWSMPFAGVALVLYFLGMGDDSGSDGDGHAR